MTIDLLVLIHCFKFIIFSKSKKDRWLLFKFLLFKRIKTTSAKLKKSKCLVVCKGLLLNKGIRTECISENFDIKNKAESLFL